MAILRVQDWTAIDDPSAYDLHVLHIRQKVDIYMSRQDGRFKLHPKALKDPRGHPPRIMVTLKEGSYTQIMLMALYLTTLEKEIA